MRVTLNDIAKRYGVTKAAVSMALRDSPRISRERREQIQKLAREMGYAPDPFLAGLSKYRFGNAAAKSVGAIAWLNHWQEPARLRSYRDFELYFQSSKKAARALGYKLEEVFWPQDCPAEVMQKRLLKRGVLGLLIPPHPPETDWTGFDWNHFSLMRFGMTVKWPDSNLVTADQQGAMVMAVSRIHERGYRRIGLIYSEAHDQSMGGGYYGGFLWAHRVLAIQNFLPPLDSDCKTPELADRTRRNLKTWMKEHRPDAILSASVEAVSFLYELGCRIPEDVGLAGMSVNDIAADAGVDQGSENIGRIATEMLIKQISLKEQGIPADPCRILVECRWRDGKTLPVKAG